MNKAFITLSIMASCLVAACTKNEMMDYQAPGKVYFFERTYLNSVEKVVSSKTFSFALQNSTLMSDTFKIKVKLMGNLTNADRTFRAEVVADSSTATAGLHYKLLDGVMHAGQYMAYLPVVLYRTADTQDESVKIKLRLTNTGNLLPGNAEYQTFSLTWGDILLKPDNWPDYYFGVYSKNKYRFAIDILGLTDWPQTARVTTQKVDGVYTIAEIQAFAAKLNEAYATYKTTHGPIYVDDNAESKEEIYYGKK